MWQLLRSIIWQLRNSPLILATVCYIITIRDSITLVSLRSL
jgi:hypothetical protein